MSSFFAALQFLTIIPWPRRADCSADELGRATIFFPVIGFLLGLTLVVVNVSLKSFASPVLSSVALVTLLAWLTRGLHLDGLGDTFDGLGAGGDREHMLRVMDDSHTGAFGVIAIVLLLFFKIHAIEAIDSERWRALLAAPVLSRWAMVLLGYRSKAAKAGLGSTLIDHLSAKHVFHLHVRHTALGCSSFARYRCLHDGLGRHLQLGEQELFSAPLGWCDWRHFRRRWRIERDLGIRFLGFGR